MTLPWSRREIEQLRREGGVYGRAGCGRPVGAFLADRTDSHKDASVRRALAPLAPPGRPAVPGRRRRGSPDEGPEPTPACAGDRIERVRERRPLGPGRRARPRSTRTARAGWLWVLAHVSTNWGSAGVRCSPRISRSCASSLDDGSRRRALTLWVDRRRVERQQSRTFRAARAEGSTEVEEEIRAALAEGQAPEPRREGGRLRRRSG